MISFNLGRRVLSTYVSFFSAFLVGKGDTGTVSFQRWLCDHPARRFVNDRLCDVAPKRFEATRLNGLVDGAAGESELISGFSEGVTFFGGHVSMRFISSQYLVDNIYTPIGLWNDWLAVLLLEIGDRGFRLVVGQIATRPLTR